VTLQPAAGERQPEPDLVMQLHQTMQRRPRGAPGSDPDNHRNHHAHFDRKAR